MEDGVMNGRLIYSDSWLHSNQLDGVSTQYCTTPHLTELEPGKGQVSWHLFYFLGIMLLKQCFNGGTLVAVVNLR